ncbi:MAG: hypothetical protein K0R14_42 [Burkholderiales bacterium]|jgi:hypothetical protein|nr:hypothetical protein [Burkholderiales bacterium]
MFNKYIKAAALSLVCLTFTACMNNNAGSSGSPTTTPMAQFADGNPIGILSWNVKGDTRQLVNGGWNVVSPNGGNQGKQIDFIKSQIASKQVDFINLVQTLENHGSNSTQLDKVLGSDRWGGIYSDCILDATQIIYDKTKWTPIGPDFPHGGFKGCKPSNDDRPYSMAMFKNIDPLSKKLLFISVHLPHNAPDASWTELKTFKDSVTALINSNGGARNVRVIMAGDMNEVGADFYNLATKDFIDTLNGSDFTIPGALSAEKNSCCREDSYIYFFDKVYATNSTITETSMDDTDYNIVEQHRPIYVVVKPIKQIQ